MSIQLTHALGPVVKGAVDAAVTSVYFDDAKDELVIECWLDFLRPTKKDPLAHFRTPPRFRQIIPLAKLRDEADAWQDAVRQKVPA